MPHAIPVQPKDSRGYFMLPQAPEDAGYYVYGTPGKGEAQYAHPAMITLLFMVEREWALIDKRKFGVGNISIADGGDFGHKSHRKGLEVDVRPLRKDGLQLPVSYLSHDYDLDATEVLIQLFRTCAAYPLVVFFNDRRIPGTAPLAGHDNHFHVQF
ncbi:penicillin-insensitive murein endopeptidase [Massilia solisilvae]|uniref:Penicillin-insensitive murein endopeptidase n=1 Tax=Massilia solisilvae TaxID=1811225 RepID=A0ABT2BFE7_9BURK|nr:penicillin-insensitive murein endopeptidase [Massilia solisilvae]MCS0607240.1 penicillin-insensitive murein endopeptidase [Massilia solisilvae]